MKYLARREGYWIYRRRVPLELRELDPRGFVKAATGVAIADDPRGQHVAAIITRINGEVERYWASLLGGQSSDAAVRYRAAVDRARQRGFAYRPVADLAAPDSDAADLVARIERLQADGLDRPGDVVALLGGEDAPGLMLSALFEEFEAVTAVERLAMSEDQLRKWRNPKVLALATLTHVVADKPLDKLTRADALALRAALQVRVASGEVRPETANKTMGHLSRMVSTVCNHHQWPLANPFQKLRFQGEGDEQRIAWPRAFVQDVLLRTGALDGLNEEARAITYLVAEVGCRLSEACNAAFVVDAEIPHLAIRAEGRQTKTRHSPRDIPLTGVALMVARAFPGGFERYRHKPDSLSALVNKYLRNNDLRPSDEHTVYGLRHTFEDRLTEVEAPDKVAAALMGHGYHRPRYGKGPSLELKLTYLQRISFTAPERI